MQKIDDNHTNVCAKWIDMGKPEPLTDKQVFLLEKVSLPREEILPYSYKKNSLALEIEVPPLGVAFISIQTV